MNNQKETERLKWECLKRSDRFWDTWEYIWSEAPANKPILKSDPIVKLVKQWLDTGKRDKKEFNKYLDTKIAYFNYCLDNWPHPELQDTLSQYYVYLLNNAPETADFEKMWQTVFVEQKPIYDQISTFKRPVEDYRERINKDIDNVVRNFQKQIKRNPNINELKAGLGKLFYLNNSSTYLVITQYDRTNKELKALLKDISIVLKRNIPSRKRVRKEEFERYLKVFDLRQDDVKWKDVSKIIYPRKKYDESIRLSLIADFKKAKRIIEDVETGKL